MAIKPIKEKSELKACASILMAAYNAEPWNDKWTHESALAKLECFYVSPKFHGWMLFEGDELQGACVGNIEPYYTGDYFYLKEMFVSPKVQRKGTGRMLFERIKSDLVNLKIEMVVLFTSNESYPFDFWKKEGFEEMNGMRMMAHM